MSLTRLGAYPVLNFPCCISCSTESYEFIDKAEIEAKAKVRDDRDVTIS